ncbi:prepilin peptidase [Streptomyces sp. SB3404]|uniref:Prepilin peptidase n=1 Tax=Streptomyces boncukensis TaxID=2711219 RepID=A0A6G4X7L2_9ACTN|nr:prepilin peptidase [Streptomyces boncukensis]
MTWVLIAGGVGYGAAAGASLPRAAYRLSVEPGEPWRSRCPAGHDVRGWLGAAPCREGARGERARFAAVGALVCAALAAAVGARPELGVWLLLAPAGLLLAAVDRRVNRLPDVLTLPLAGATAALLGVAALLPGAGGAWVRALLGGAALAGAYGVLFLVSPRAVGFGDVKLALPLGVALGWYGWDVLITGALLGFLLLGGYGGTLLLARRATWGTALAFGPFMVLGALLGVALGGLTA